MKMSKTLVLTACLVLASSSAFAFDPEGGDSDKGKEAFATCRECHDGGKAKNLSPAHKTKKQWSRYFAKDFKKLKRKMPDFDSAGYDDAFLEDVHRYLVDHALDSDKPQTCD